MTSKSKQSNQNKMQSRTPREAQRYARVRERIVTHKRRGEVGRALAERLVPPTAGKTWGPSIPCGENKPDLRTRTAAATSKALKKVKRKLRLAKDSEAAKSLRAKWEPGIGASFEDLEQALWGQRPLGLDDAARALLEQLSLTRAGAGVSKTSPPPPGPTVDSDADDGTATPVPVDSLPAPQPSSLPDGNGDTTEDAATGGASASASDPRLAAAYVEAAVGELLAQDGLQALNQAGGLDYVAMGAKVGEVHFASGPADATSFHEFHSVRIAYEALWEELLDGQLHQLSEQLFAGLADFEEALGYEEITSLESLAPLLALVRDLGGDIDELALAPVPESALTVLPALTPSSWHALQPGERELIELYAKRYADARELIFQEPGKTAQLERPNGNYYDANGTPKAYQGDYYKIIGPVLPDAIDLGGIRIAADVVEDALGVDIRVQYLVIAAWRDEDSANRYYVHQVHRNSGEWILSVKNESGSEISKRHYMARADALDQVKKLLRKQAEDVLAVAAKRPKPTSPSEDEGPRRVSSVLEALAAMLDNLDAYRFKVFAPGSVNYGILLRYRQAWTPLGYQAGELVKTLPLAPGEVRRFKTQTVVKKQRNRKEIENALRTKADSSRETGRKQAEVVQRAKNSTSFQATAEGKGSVGVVEFGGTATASTSAAQDSARTKRKFREAVLKAASEMRNERRLEITTMDSEEVDSSSSGEVSNPNHEITVTYLFYELQRRFEVSEELVEVVPVVLVAHDVPLPSEITQTWLLRHDWILERVLLDDSFADAFDLLRRSDMGRDLELGVLRDDMNRKVAAFESIKEQLAGNVRTRQLADQRLQEAVEQHVAALNAQPGGAAEAVDVATTVFSGGWLGSHGLLGLGGGTDPYTDNPEAAEARQEAIEDLSDRLQSEGRRLRTLLEGAQLGVDQAIAKYAAAVRRRLDKELAVMRLRAHVAQNIFHYMQAIWEYEPSDQRYFRLHDIQAPVLSAGAGVTVAADGSVSVELPPDGANLDITQWEPLSDLADLDQPLGFRGNYTVFPLRQHNYLTAWMTLDYLGADGSLIDPDPPAEFGPRDLAGMLEELEQRVKKREVDNEVASQLRTYLTTKLAETEPTTEDVVVPSDMLFIEALPGTHSLSEPFKLRHKALDVAKVSTQVRAAQLENIRVVARLLNRNYTDTDVDRIIQVQGAVDKVEVDAGS